MAKEAKVVDLHEAAISSLIEKTRALGNSKRGLKEVASDLINREGRNHIKQMAEGMFLSRHTVARVADCDPHYKPQADTIERVLKYFSVEIRFNEVALKPRFHNKPKDEV